MENKKSLFFPAFLVLYEFTVYMANDLIMPGMMHVVRDFHAHSSIIPVTLSAYLLGGSSLQLVIGPLSDSIGRRKVMLVGVLTFILFTFFIAMSFSMNSFILGRLLQGSGLCFINTIGYAAIQEFYDETRAIRLIAIMAMAALLAPLFGPILGGIFIEHFSWRFVFFFIGILALISFAGLSFFMPETAHFHYTQDRTFVKKLDRTLVPKVRLKTIISSYGRLLKDLRFICGACAYGLFVSPLLCWISASPLVLSEKYHLRGLQFGLVQAPLFGALILSNLTLNQLAKKYAPPALSRLGMVISLLGLVLSVGMTSVLGPHYLNLIIPLSVYCFGLSLLSAPLNRQILFSTPMPKGVTSGLLSLFINGILIVSTALMSFVYRHSNDLHFAVFVAMCGIIGSICMHVFMRKKATIDI